MPERDVVAVVAVGGIIGSLLRYALDLAVPPVPGTWPWATFTVNVLGAGALGAVLAWALARLGPAASAGTRLGRWARPFLATGVLGGFTTFSALSMEVRDMLAVGAAPLALAYGLASVVAGVLAVAAGARLVRGTAQSLAHEADES